MYYVAPNLVLRPPSQTFLHGCEIKSGREAWVRGYVAPTCMWFMYPLTPCPVRGIADIQDRQFPVPIKRECFVYNRTP